MMLSREDLQRYLKRVSYRPGWGITLEEDPYEGLFIRIVAEVEDSYNPGSTTTLGINSYLPPLPDEGCFYDWLLWRLARVESHECREWFKVSGIPWQDPHEQ